MSISSYFKFNVAFPDNLVGSVAGERARSSPHLVAAVLLATGMSVLISFLIDRQDADPFPYDQTLEIYARFTVLAYMLFIGLVVSSLSFDSNRDLSTFLRLRFSVKRILITKILVFQVMVNVLVLLSFGLTFALATFSFDSKR